MRNYLFNCVTEMVASFDIFRNEMIRLFGDKQVIPSRSELRRSNRTDIEKAISAHGGPAMVAKRLGWINKGRYRKPKGYWNSIENVKQEIDEFIALYDLPIGTVICLDLLLLSQQRLLTHQLCNFPGTMPIKNDFIRANRFDLARAIERWGGLYCLAEQLGYKVATSSLACSSNLQTGTDMDTSIRSGDEYGLFTILPETDSPSSFNEGSKEQITGEKTNMQTGIEEKVIASKKKSFPRARDEIDAW